MKYIYFIENYLCLSLSTCSLLVLGGLSLLVRCKFTGDILSVGSYFFLDLRFDFFFLFAFLFVYFGGQIRIHPLLNFLINFCLFLFCHFGSCAIQFGRLLLIHLLVICSEFGFECIKHRVPLICGDLRGLRATVLGCRGTRRLAGGHGLTTRWREPGRARRRWLRLRNLHLRPRSPDLRHDILLGRAINELHFWLLVLNLHRWLPLDL